MTLNSRFYDNRRSQEHNSGKNELEIFFRELRRPRDVEQPEKNSRHFARPPLVSPFEHQKRRFSKRAFRVEIVENASFSFTNGRTKTDAFDHTAYGMLAYFHRSSVFVWTGENDSNTLRVDAYFSENGENVFKLSIFLKNPNRRGRGLSWRFRPMTSRYLQLCIDESVLFLV